MTALKPARPGPEPGPPRVLVVEDNVVNQQLVLAMLGRSGFVAEVAVDGQEALALLRARHFDAVLMDLQMPVMDGLQATREIRRPGSGVVDPAIPIIAVTANAFAEDRARSFAAGMNEFLTKPLDPRRLLEALARWVPVPPAPLVRAAGSERGPGAASVPAERGEPDAATRLDGVAILDEAGLLERAMADRDLAADLLEAFVHEYPAMRDALRDAIGRADPLAVMNLAHTLKGASANVGALRVCIVATRLEEEAAGAAAPRLGDRFLELDRHLVEFERVVAAARGRPPPGVAP